MFIFILQENLFRILEESDVRSLRSIPLHLYNLNFLYDKSKVVFDKQLSPLLVACYIGKVEIIQILFTNDQLNVNFPSFGEGYTPLMVALYKGFYEITKFLLDNKADVNQLTKSGHYPILFCFSRLEDNKYKYENRTLCMLMIDLMLMKGADLNIRVDNDPGFNILMKLLSVDIEDDESYQTTCSIVKFLIERGADKQMTTFTGLSLYDTIKSENYKNNLVKLINSTEQIYYYNNTINNNNNSAYQNTNTNNNTEYNLLGKQNDVNNLNNKDRISSVMIDSKCSSENCCVIF